MLYLYVMSLMVFIISNRLRIQAIDKIVYLCIKDIIITSYRIYFLSLLL